MTINVVLADDHTIIRDGLKALLEANPRIKVVGDASDGNQAVKRVEELLPDVVLMDISMPELNGVDAMVQILEAAPKARVIILSMLGTADYVLHAMQAGARGFLLKESAGREVMEAVIAVYAGEMYFSRPIIDTLIDDYMQVKSASSSDSLDHLSERERDILRMVVEGKTNSEIASHLSLSLKTIEANRSRVMQKLGVSDFAELIKFAILHGMIASERTAKRV